MKSPCIIVVQYILPALRVLIAKELIEKHGLRRVRAAEKMELTPAAIRARKGDLKTFLNAEFDGFKDLRTAQG